MRKSKFQAIQEVMFLWWIFKKSYSFGNSALLFMEASRKKTVYFPNDIFNNAFLIHFSDSDDNNVSTDVNNDDGSDNT